MEEEITKFARKHRNLLLLEREENLENFYKDLSPNNLKQLEKKGQAFTKLVINNVANKGSGRFQIDLGYPDELMFDYGLSPGDLVLCLRQNKLKNAIKGVVTELTDTSVSIAVTDHFDNIEEDENFSLIKTDSDVTYKWQTRALSNLERKDLYNLPCYNIIKIAFGNDENVEALLSTDDPIAEKYLNDNKMLEYFNSNLADDQRSAVSFALKRRHLAIIQGPPGTGKTTTLIELIRQLEKLKKKILVCAPTNVAVDNIVNKLSETNVKPLRLGHPSRISKQSQPFALDAYVKQNDGYSVLRDIEQSMKELSIKASNNETWKYKEIRELKKEHKKRLNKLTSEVLKNSTVVLSTLNSATPKEGYLQHIPEDFFDVLIVDEASQAMEASMWIALPNARKLVMAGDINQLPPVVMSQEASDKGLSLSLMERMIKKFKDKTFVSLTRQYRMHEKIMSWSSKYFYNNTLEADGSVKSHLLKDLKGVKNNEITSDPLIFIDTCGCDCEEYKVNDESGSKGNPGEAIIVEKVVSALIGYGVQSQDIGVITPYALQVDLIRKSLGNNYKTEVKTVDGFQGREKEVIVLSLVRSNQEKELGFVTDFRRLNVAVTRARRLLVLIADSETMEKNELITTLLKHIDENGTLQTAEEYLLDSNDKKEDIEKSSKKSNVTSNTKSNKVDKKKNTVENHPVEKLDKAIKSSKKGLDLASYINKKHSNVFGQLAVEDETLETDQNTVKNDCLEKRKPLETSKKQKKKNVRVTEPEIKPKKEDDFDTIIAEFSKSNYVCSFESCKVSTKLIHLTCEFCKQWYCLQHGLQEVHGCGDAVRRKERKEFRHQMPPSVSKKEKDKFARKLKELEDARKPKKKTTK